MSSKFKPTQEQLDIVNTFSKTKVLKINAVAGSGKTSTLELLAEANQIPSLYISFNKSIAMEASDRFPKHVKCVTAHALAYASKGKLYAHKLESNQKYSKANTARTVSQIVDYFKLEDYSATPNISGRTVAALARDTIRKFCFSADKEINETHIDRDELKVIQKGHDFEMKKFVKVVIAVANMLWQEKINPVTNACISHDVYLKLWSLENPVLNFDIIYGDEQQDSNACLLAVLRQQSSKVCYVGDNHQGIYAWRGAVNAMQIINAPEMELSQSWRYGEEIAKVAERILKKYDISVKGNPSIDSTVINKNTSSVYTKIFRTNSALFNELAYLQQQGKKVHAEAGVKEYLLKLKSILALKQGKVPFHDDVAKYTNYTDLLIDSEDEPELKALVGVVERRDIDRFINSLEAVKDSKGDNCNIILTTGHKSKGREWDVVEIAQDFKFSDKSSEQELNLLYVACTRAKKTLVLPENLFSVLSGEEDEL